jgi:hypothetical protein
MMAAAAQKKTTADETTPPPAPEADAAATADPAPDVAEVPEICGVCWPDGWPVNDVAASCEHGQWQR